MATIVSRAGYAERKDHENQDHAWSIADKDGAELISMPLVSCMNVCAYDECSSLSTSQSAWTFHAASQAFKVSKPRRSCDFDSGPGLLLAE